MIMERRLVNVCTFLFVASQALLVLAVFKSQLEVLFDNTQRSRITTAGTGVAAYSCSV